MNVRAYKVKHNRDWGLFPANPLFIRFHLVKVGLWFSVLLLNIKKVNASHFMLQVNSKLFIILPSAEHNHNTVNHARGGYWRENK